MQVSAYLKLSIAVALEKMVPRGERIATVLGVALIAAGAYRLIAT